MPILLIVQNMKNLIQGAKLVDWNSSYKSIPMTANKKNVKESGRIFIFYQFLSF